MGINYKKNRIYSFLFLLVWCLQMLTAVYFCCQKQGFHEDEFYTYYSTARTNGLFVEDGAWMEREDYFNEFVVLKGQRFQYGLVRLVQSWDVHPPVYYWIFHTVCSFFPGRFSKWFGLGINLAAFGLSLFLLRILAMKITGRNEKLSLLVCLFYGFTPAVMSSVVFIRMYALLVVFVYLCAILHIGVLEREGKESVPSAEKNCEKAARSHADGLSFRKFLLPLMVVTYLGFLTQYYYFIFLFFMGFAFCLYLLWRDRNLWNCIRYGGSQAVVFVLAYLTYPSWPGQMFRGQRGAQATSNFFDVSNTLTRISFFWELMEEYVFGKMLLPLLIILFIMAVYLVWRRNAGAGAGKMQSSEEQSREKQDSEGQNWKKQSSEEQNWKKQNSEEQNREKQSWRGNDRVVWILLFCAVSGYFLAVSKTALLLGDTSVRYQMPVYGMAVLLLFGMIWKIAERFGKKGIVAASALVLLCMLSNLSALFSGRVVFLYPEAEERLCFAEEQAARNTPVICLYDAGQSWCVWDCADEFFEYERIYFASQNDTAPIADAVVAESEALVVYLSGTAEKQEQLQRILDSNPRLTEYELKYQEKYCDVYYFHG